MFHNSGISFVVQNEIQIFVVYEFSVLSATTAFLEFVRNGNCLVSLRIHQKRVFHDFAFVFVHNVFFVNDIIAENILSARGFAFAPTFFQSSIDFLRKFFRKVLIKTFQNGFHHTTFGTIRKVLHCRENCYAVISERLFVYYRFKLVAREPIKFVNDKVLPLFAAAVFQHFLKCDTVVVCSRHSAVDIGVDYEYIVVLSILSTHTKLSFNRLFGLAIAGITGINNCFFHFGY